MLWKGLRNERTTLGDRKGKFADLAVLNRNIFECDPEELFETRVLLTLLEGRPVYHAEDSPMLASAEGLKTPDMWR